MMFVVHPERQLVMAGELVALERTNTWDLVSPPPCANTFKWVYKVKTHSYGSLEHYKSSSCGSSFQQEHCCDYDETFAHVAM